MKTLNESPDPPSIDTLACIIDETLRYSEMVALIDEAATYFRNDGQMTDATRTFEQFVDWARN